MQNQTLIIVAVVLFVVAALLGSAIVAVMFLTGGQTYDIPVASQDIGENTRIKQSHLSTETLEEQPEEGVIRDAEQIVGKVTKNNISSGSSFQSGDLRNNFRVSFTTQSIPAGTRIQQTMLQVRESEDKPSDAVTDPSVVVGKMVRESVPANQILKRSDVYMQEQDFVVATEPIEANSMVRESQLKVESRPSGPSDGVSDITEVTGKPIKQSIEPGEAVRESDIYPGESQLSYFIPMYKRAVSIPVEDHNSYSNMIKPGDVVDLYAYAPREHDVPRKTNGDVEIQTETVYTLQKIADAATVLSLNDKFTKEQIEQFKAGGENGRNFDLKNMTFGVSLKESERLSLVRGMQNSGVEISYFAVLRPRILKSKYGVNRDITDYELFNPTSEGSTNRLRGEKTVEVIHGDQKEVYKVPSR